VRRGGSPIRRERTTARWLLTVPRPWPSCTIHNLERRREDFRGDLPCFCLHDAMGKSLHRYMHCETAPCRWPNPWAFTADKQSLCAIGNHYCVPCPERNSMLSSRQQLTTCLILQGKRKKPRCGLWSALPGDRLCGSCGRISLRDIWVPLEHTHFQLPLYARYYASCLKC
jgi:hypothetical protein